MVSSYVGHHSRIFNFIDIAEKSSTMSATGVFVAGSTALVTGAASGIGLAIAKLCVDKGMNVLLADRNEEALEEAKNSLTNGSGKVKTAVVDVSNGGDWQKLEELASSQFGSIELLVLNAGTTAKGTWGDGSYFRTVSKLSASDDKADCVDP